MKHIIKIFKNTLRRPKDKQFMLQQSQHICFYEHHNHCHEKTFKRLQTKRKDQTKYVYAKGALVAEKKYECFSREQKQGWFCPNPLMSSPRIGERDVAI